MSKAVPQAAPLLQCKAIPAAPCAPHSAETAADGLMHVKELSTDAAPAVGAGMQLAPVQKLAALGWCTQGCWRRAGMVLGLQPA